MAEKASHKLNPSWRHLRKPCASGPLDVDPWEGGTMCRPQLQPMLIPANLLPQYILTFHRS